MKIICIGRNYSKHAKELGNDIPEEPIFFIKPDSSILPIRNPLYIPEWTNELHYEVELVVKINRLGYYIDERHAHKYYDKVGIGIDFTARDVQRDLKAKGLPWEKAKSFDGAAAIGKKFFSIKELGGNIQDISFSLMKNNEVVQSTNSSEMLFSVDKLISHVSQFMSLKIGDLIFTGTPSGVGKVDVNDELTCFIGEEKLLHVNIK